MAPVLRSPVLASLFLLALAALAWAAPGPAGAELTERASCAECEVDEYCEFGESGGVSCVRYLDSHSLYKRYPAPSCGSLGEPCCPGVTKCNSGLGCTNSIYSSGVCSCGGYLEVCCGGSTCNEGACVVGSTCYCGEKDFACCTPGQPWSSGPYWDFGCYNSTCVDHLCN